MSCTSDFVIEGDKMNYKMSEFNQNLFFEEFEISPEMFKIEGINITDSKIEFLVDKFPQSIEKDAIFYKYFGLSVTFKSFNPQEKAKALSVELKKNIGILDGVLDDVKFDGEKVRIEVSNDYVRDRISVNGSKHMIDKIVSDFFPGKSIEIAVSPSKQEMSLEDVMKVSVSQPKGKGNVKKQSIKKVTNVEKINNLEVGGSYWIAGKTFSFDYRNGKNSILSFGVFDGTAAITCKAFGTLASSFSDGIPDYCIVSGKVQEDKFTHETVLIAKSIDKWEPEMRDRKSVV